MTRSFTAHFDGKVLVPDEPVDLPIGESLTVTASELPADAPTGQEFIDLFKDFRMTPEEVAEMQREIDESCGQVNPDDWK